MIGSIRNSIGFIAFLVAATLAVAEVGVRVGSFAPSLTDVLELDLYAPDTLLPFRLRANHVATGRSMSGEFDYRYVHNSAGFRDHEHSTTNSSGRFRILGVGDSLTYGIGVPFEETYLRRIERRLNAGADGPNVEVLKFGVPRFFPAAEVLLVRHYGLAYEPDLLLVGFTPNDVVDTHLGLDAVDVSSSGHLITSDSSRIFHRFGPIARWGYQNLHLARLGLTVLSVRRQSVSSKRIPFGDVYRDEGGFEASWREVEASLRELVAMMQERGKETVLIHIPIAVDQNRAAYAGWRLSNVAEAVGAHFVDTLPALREESGGRPFFWPIEGHATSEGHRIFAEAIVDYLVSRDLVN